MQVAVMALVLLLLAIPTAIIDTGAGQQLYTVSLDLDRFLDAVRADTPANARVLVLDPATDPHYHLSERSRYVLYPRLTIFERVPSKRVPATRIAGGGLALRWADVLRSARHRRAGYILMWVRVAGTVTDAWSGLALPSLPHGPLVGRTVQLRSGWGVLVRVGP